MQNWDAAGDKLRRRSVSAIIDSIAVETPFIFSPVDDASDVPDFLDEGWDTLSPASDIVLDLPGRDVNFCRDLLISISKFYHVADCAARARNRGALTWTLVDAYHASLLGSRAISAFYGALSYSVRGRTVVVDFRPELGSVDERKRFARDNRGIAEPVRILKPKKEKLDQSEAWKLLRRLEKINDSPADGEEALAIRDVSAVTSLPLSSVRNLILYDSVYWTWRTDFDATPISPEEALAKFVSDDDKVIHLLDALSKISNLVSIHTQALLRHLEIDPGTLPQLSARPPGSLSLHVL